MDYLLVWIPLFAIALGLALNSARKRNDDD